jgi:signal transduction histidine kinase
MGGECDITSAPGQGTRVSLRVPLAAGRPTAKDISRA